MVAHHFTLKKHAIHAERDDVYLSFQTCSFIPLLPEKFCNYIMIRNNYGK